MTGAIDPSFINPIYSGASLSDDITNTNTNLFGSGNDPTVTNPVQSQAAVDLIHQSVHGGVATGLPTTTVLPNMQKIPQSNIAITPSNSTTVTVDAAGTWGTPVTAGHAPGTVTGTHVIGSSANYLLVMVPYITYGIPEMSVTCGSTPMAQLTTPAVNGIAAFGLADPPTGTQTLTVSTSTNVYLLDAESTSLIGVDSVGTVTAHNGSATNPSMSFSSAANRCVVQMFFNTTSSGSAALSSYSQTQLVNTGPVSATPILSSNISDFAVLSGYAPGATSVSFTATSATTTTAQTWYGLAVELRPSAAPQVGSGFRQWRSLGAVSATSGTAYFPPGFFDQTQYCTTDITPTTSGAAGIQISYAGWYMVKINCALASTSTNYYIRPVLYQGAPGAPPPVQHGDTLFVSTTTTNFTTGDSFIVYCNTGDVLVPGYWCSTNVTNLLTGDGNGYESYWEVALLNRSYM